MKFWERLAMSALFLYFLGWLIFLLYWVYKLIEWAWPIVYEWTQAG